MPEAGREHAAARQPERRAILRIANAYVQMRHIPVNNILYLVPRLNWVPVSDPHLRAIPKRVPVGCSAAIARRIDQPD